MDEQLAKEYRAAIADFYDQYPELKGFVDDIDTKVTTFGATGQADIAWEYKGINANISTSVSFSATRNYEEYLKDVAANFENKSKFENDGVEANAYHELSHQLQRMVYYSEKGLYKDGEFVPQSIMADLNKVYDVSSDSNKIVRSALKTVGGKNYNYHELTDYLGTYAQSNNTEMVAQAMAYEMSGKTNPFSAEIKRQMDERYQKVLENNGKSSTIYADKIISSYIENPETLGQTTHKEKYDDFKNNGVDVKPLAQGSLKGKQYEDGGGYKVAGTKDGQYFQYHPADSSHHNNSEYYKLSSGTTGKKRYDMDGNLIE